jgi:hypothetical protein
LQIKRFGIGLLVAAGSFVLAAPAFAGFSSLRLNGAFSLEDESQANANIACVVADFEEFEVFGNVSGTSGACTVNVFYSAFVPNKTSASVLKDDNRGSAKLSQQVETFVNVSISGAECATPFSGTGFPEKCKVNGSVNATEGAPDVVEKGKVSVSCDLASPDASAGTVGDLTEAQIDTIQAAIADRKDVKLTDDGKLTIKTKGVADADNNCVS